MRLITFPVEAHDVLSPDSILPTISRLQRVDSLFAQEGETEGGLDEIIPLSGDDSACAFRWWGINE